MSIGVKTPGLHHISLRSTDLPRSRRFYHDVLGFAIFHENDELCLVQAGGSMVGLRAPAPETAAGDAFNPFRVGLDHVAFACESLDELQRVAAALDGEGVWNTGVKELAALGAHYLAFKDPDGIKLELWLDG
jgi:glyoxylase I family protein